MVIARVLRIRTGSGSQGTIADPWRPELPQSLERPNGWQHIAEGPPDADSPTGYFLVALPDATPSEVTEIRRQRGTAIYRPDELAQLPSHWRPLADSQLLGWERRGR